MRINCFGDKVSSLHCKIVLLDEQQLVHEVLVTSTGQDVLNVVYQHLGSTLLETAYFGLRYVDASHQPQWLDPNKRVLQQLKGTGSQTLYFAVKFYAVDPCKLVEELTRYQFFLQVKKDILQGRLPVTTELAAELAALALQSELGDYDPHRYKPGYVSEFRFLAHQSPDLETKIAELHKTMRGLVPAVAEMRYLDRVKWLDLYGVDLHPVLGEDTVEYFLGLTPSGIIVLRNKTKVGNYFWPRISKIQFKGRYFMLRVRDKSNDENTFGFETPSKSACKSLYKCCSQHLAFFRLVQMSGPLLTSATITATTGNHNNNSIGSKFLKLSGAAAPTTTTVGQQQTHSPPQFRRMPSRRHQRRIVDGASHPAPPPVDECSTSDSDKTLDAASTATLLSPYHSKVGEATQQVPVGGGVNGDNWAEASSVRSRRSRSRSHSRSRKERRSSSVDSTESRSHRRKSHRNRSRQNSDNESEASRASESSRNSRRRRHRSSRDSSGSESDHQSSHHRSHRRNKRRGSHGSTYELVDSEAQWREIQERQGLQQSQAATVRPAASSTPLQQQPVLQQATVRKASNAVNVSTSSANDSLLDQSHSDLTAVETNSQASSRHRHHRKHNNQRHHHKHRSHSRHSSEKSVKPSLPSEIMPHLQFQLVDPPAGSTSDQLREIPYQVVSSPQIVPSPTIHTADVKDHQLQSVDNQSLNRKRHRGLHQQTYPEERKIISVDNDSPPPPYSPPQNVDALAQSLASLNIPAVNRPRGRVDINTNNPSLAHSGPPINAASANPPIAPRTPLAPIPGPKPNKSMRPKGNFPPGQTSSTSSSSSSSSYAPQYSMASNSSHPASNLVANGRHYAQHSTAPGHNPVATSNGFYSGNNSSINHMQAQYHQDNRRGTILPPPPPPPSSLPPPPPTNNSSTPSVYNGFHYPFSSPANASAPISPHHVGLPLTAFSANHSNPSPQVQNGSIQQATKSSVAPLTLPRLNVPSTPTLAMHSNNSGSSGKGNIHHNEKNKSSMPLSPLANGVTVTNQLQPNLGDMLSTTRQTMQTKYVTRPQTPVTHKTFAMNLTSYPGQPGHQRLPHSQTMTLPGRGTRCSNRTNSQHFMTDEKFSIQPSPTFAYPDHNSAAWHASTLPRLVRHLPATSQTGNSAIRYESTLSRPESGMSKNRRASSLELILSPMVESTLQRKKRAT